VRQVHHEEELPVVPNLQVVDGEVSLVAQLSYCRFLRLPLLLLPHLCTFLFLRFVFLIYGDFVLDLPFLLAGLVPGKEGQLLFDIQTRSIQYFLAVEDGCLLGSFRRDRQTFEDHIFL
jgi:hypothetical protein